MQLNIGLEAITLGARLSSVIENYLRPSIAS